MRKRFELNQGCMAKAFDQEPTFVLLARDVVAPAAIREWCRLRYLHGKNGAQDAQITEALAIADVMADEQKFWHSEAKAALTPAAPETPTEPTLAEKVHAVMTARVEDVGMNFYRTTPRPNDPTAPPMAGGSMPELKIPEDLQKLHDSMNWAIEKDLKMCPASPQLILELIERIARLTADNAALRAEIQSDRLVQIGDLKVIESLKQELARYRAPVSDQEWAKHGSTYDGIPVCARRDVDALIESRKEQK